MSDPEMLVAGGRAVSLSTLRSMRVTLPAGGAYWTLVDADYRVVEAGDASLRDLRFGADRTESTTKQYAGELALCWVGRLGPGANWSARRASCPGSCCCCARRR